MLQHITPIYNQNNNEQLPLFKIAKDTIPFATNGKLSPRIHHHPPTAQHPKPAPPQTPNRQKSPPTHLPSHDQPSRAERRVLKSRYHETQETKLGPAKDRQSPIEHGQGGERVYPGRGA
jgi:hypothetical protein